MEILSVKMVGEITIIMKQIHYTHVPSQFAKMDAFMDFANPQIFVPVKLDGKESVVIFVFLGQAVIMDIAIQNWNAYVKMVGQEHCVINVNIHTLV